MIELLEDVLIAGARSYLEPTNWQASNRAIAACDFLKFARAYRRIHSAQVSGRITGP